MQVLKKISDQLKAEFPIYNFPIYQGLFEKYIAVEIHEKIPFTIWVDKNTGYKELLDEVSFHKNNWIKKKLKSKLFHWTKYKISGPRKNYIRIMHERQQLSLPERKLVKKRLELFLQKIHIT